MKNDMNTEVKTMAENMAFDWRDFEKYGVEAVVLCNVEDEDKPVLGICVKGTEIYGGEEYILDRLSYDYADREGEHKLSFEKWMYKHADKLASLIKRYIDEGMNLNFVPEAYSWWYRDKVRIYAPEEFLPKKTVKSKIREENGHVELIMN